MAGLLDYALAGSLYCALVYGRVSHLFWGSTPGLAAAITIAVVAVRRLPLFPVASVRKERSDSHCRNRAGQSLTLLTSAITLNNLFNPRDDTLGRIGFDMVPERQDCRDPSLPSEKSNFSGREA